MAIKMVFGGQFVGVCAYLGFVEIRIGGAFGQKIGDKLVFGGVPLPIEVEILRVNGRHRVPLQFHAVMGLVFIEVFGSEVGGGVARDVQHCTGFLGGVGVARAAFRDYGVAIFAVGQFGVVVIADKGPSNNEVRAEIAVPISP